MPIGQELLDRIEQNDQTLRIVNLSRRYPDLQDTDIHQLTEALQKNHTVESLILCENSIGDDGAIVLANTLPKTPTLKHLDLSINNIGDKGAKALFGITTLESLNVAVNHISAEAARELLRNKNLVEIDIDANFEDDELQKQIENHAKLILSLKHIQQCFKSVQDLPIHLQNHCQAEIKKLYNSTFKNKRNTFRAGVFMTSPLKGHSCQNIKSLKEGKRPLSPEHEENFNDRESKRSKESPSLTT